MKRDKLLKEYLKDVTLERRLRPSSVKIFCGNIRTYLASGLSLDAAGVKAHLMTLTHAPTTVRLALTALKSFATWLFARNLINELEWARVRVLRGPKIPQRLPVVLTQKQMVTLIEARAPRPARGMLPHVFDARELRDHAFIQLSYSTGFRVSEMCSLDLHSIVNKRRDLVEIRVIGKGDVERVGYAGRKAIRALRAYLAVRDQLPDGGRPLHPTALFLGIRSGARLSASEARKIFKRKGQRVRLQQAHPHAARHSFATHLNDAGAPIPLTQKLMGHKNVESTLRYISVSDPEARKGYRKYHPGA